MEMKLLQIIKPQYLLMLLVASHSQQAMCQIEHWETIVYEDDSWSYLVPAKPVDEAWNSASFSKRWRNCGSLAKIRYLIARNGL